MISYSQVSKHSAVSNWIQIYTMIPARMVNPLPSELCTRESPLLWLPQYKINDTGNREQELLDSKQNKVIFMKV